MTDVSVERAALAVDQSPEEVALHDLVKRVAGETAVAVVFSKPSCVQCDATHRALDKKGVEYESVNIMDDPEAYEVVVAAGFQQAPIVAWLGEHGISAWSGFRPDQISQRV